jgi:hypothetical protein
MGKDVAALHGDSYFVHHLHDAGQTGNGFLGELLMVEAR